MEAEIEGAGVVKHASTSSCQISAIINGSQAILSFKQNMFYSFGMPFRGNLAKALRVGTQVKFSFVLKSAQDPISAKLLAVWVGDKPKLWYKMKVLYSDPSLEGFFGPERRLEKIYLQYANTYIHVKLSDVYDNGQKCTGRYHFDDLAEPGKTVNFEAVLTVDPDLKFPLTSSDKKFTHEALCVWIGEKPPLKTVAAALPRPDRSLLRTNNFLYGTVSKLYLPDIALVVTIPENKTVCVHSSAFQPDGNHLITDFLYLGDVLKFRVIYDTSCPIFIRAVNVSVITESELRKAERDSKEASSILFNRRPLCGSVISSSAGAAVLSCRGHKVLVTSRDFYLDGCLCSEDKFHSVLLPDSVVHFEAVSHKTYALLTKIDFHATCAWIGEKPSVPLIASGAGQQGPQIAEIMLSYAHKIFLGSITKICLPDVALIEVPLGKRNAVIDVHVSAFSDVQGQLITDFVDYGYVQFKVKQSDCLFGVCAYDVEALNEREFQTYSKTLNRWQKARERFLKK